MNCFSPLVFWNYSDLWCLDPFLALASFFLIFWICVKLLLILILCTLDVIIWIWTCCDFWELFMFCATLIIYPTLPCVTEPGFGFDVFPVAPVLYNCCSGPLYTALSVSLQRQSPGPTWIHHPALQPLWISLCKIFPLPSPLTALTPHHLICSLNCSLSLRLPVSTATWRMPLLGAAILGTSPS